MKKKKPRLATAAPAARRTVRRAARPKKSPLRRPARPARGKPARARRPKKPAPVARRKAAPAASPAEKVKKTVRRRPRTPAPRRARAPRTGARTVSRRAAAPGPERMPAARPPRPAAPAVLPSPAAPDPLIPPLLLEEDEPPCPPLRGAEPTPGPEPAAAGDPLESRGAALPGSYGTGRLVLTAREPRWLYASWDLAARQQRQYNARSADGHLVVRVHAGSIAERPAAEVHVHPESRHWFIQVSHAGAQYVAELGYYRPRRRWVQIATSAPVTTPVDAVSADRTVRFVTIPPQVRLTQLATPARPAAPGKEPPPETAREDAPAEMLAWTPELGDALSSWAEGEAALWAVAGGEAGSVSSPAAGAAEPPAPGFWFRVHTDLVIHGATEPDATVTIGGRPIPLRADGTFSCRLSLPDGEHSASVAALSARGDLRQARLRVTRATDYPDGSGADASEPTSRPGEEP